MVCPIHVFSGTKIKQADTILLGYPLLYPMPRRVRRNDLDYCKAASID